MAYEVVIRLKLSYAKEVMLPPKDESRTFFCPEPIEQHAPYMTSDLFIQAHRKAIGQKREENTVAQELGVSLLEKLDDT